jgi:hypothetical protein
MTGEVTVDSESVTLRSRGLVLDTQRRDALERVYEVWAGCPVDIFAPDVEFHVFRFSDKLWVLSWETAGVWEAIRTIWPEQRQRDERYWIAAIGEMPRDWRKSYLWGLLRPHAPALLVLPPSALPHWVIKREACNFAGFVAEHDYPYLNNLIGGWFHQDFDITGDTLEAVIADFKKNTHSDSWAETRTDIARLLNLHDDAALSGEFISLFQPGIDPEAWSGSTRRWLSCIDKLLRP